MDRFDLSLRIPDLWQQEALRALRAGKDVIVQAPTGSGKTFVFEMFFQEGAHRQSVYTVPTRALANDKLREWRDKGWNVGIATGDIAENLDAPVVVATLETQRGRFLAGKQPGLLVIDEFQMLGDPQRGVNYELVVALAEPDTQLLLMSGSVANPDTVANWLRSLGRDVELVRQDKRPVPLDEVFVDKLPDRVPAGVHGTTVRRIIRALMADMGPMLVFAPRRQAAEELARALSSALPLNDFLDLTPEQKALAGDRLGKMLRHRIAFHHSGLGYEQRAGLVEPLAKAGQLRVVVATTGLAAGINFSMRSVFVTDRHYRSGHEEKEVRPDELLQMFGRAGRRGLDERGHILFAENSPRLAEAKPLALKRADRLDWAGFLAVMRTAAEAGQSPVRVATELAGRLFSREPVRLGLENLAEYASRVADPEPRRTTRVQRMSNRHGGWERLKPETRAKLGDAWLRLDETWHPALARPETLAAIKLGSVCKLPDTKPVRYGRLVALAHFPKAEKKHHFDLAPWLVKALEMQSRSAGSHRPGSGKSGTRDHETRHPGRAGSPSRPDDAGNANSRDPRRHGREQARSLQASAPAVKSAVKTPPGRLGEAPLPKARVPVAKHRSHEWFENELPDLLPALTGGGRLHGAIFEQRGALMARLDFSEAPVRVRVDDGHHPLINPLVREEDVEDIDLRATVAGAQSGSGQPADIWLRLDLIDAQGAPTRRGVVAGFFQQSEGLAIAAALEDESYAIRDLVRDLANLRAGHRFQGVANAGNRLGAVCRLTYRGMTCPGYLIEGVPPDYGDGASEMLATLEANPMAIEQLTDDLLRRGDIERAGVEWRSLLNHIVHAPDYAWTRWTQLKAAARDHILRHPVRPVFADLPSLPGSQRGRHDKRTRFK